MVATAETVPNFLLLDQEGRAHDLQRRSTGRAAVVLYFYDAGCDRTPGDLAALEAAQTAAGRDKLSVLLLNAGPAPAPDQLPELPLLQDTAQLVTRSLGGTQAGDALVVEPGTWTALYRGPVRGGANPFATFATMVGEMTGVALPASAEGIEGSACALPLQPLPVAVDYVRDVVPILRDRCVECHRPGHIGPFAMSSHRKVKGWSDMIRETVLTRQMPPWHADPAHNAYANDRSLTVAEQRTLVTWLDAGAPWDGAGEDPLAAAAVEVKSEWPLGEPDLVLTLPKPEEVPAQGVFDYVRVRVPSGLTEDTWISAVDIHPTNRLVTHHAVVFLQYPRTYTGERFDAQGGLNGYFALYVPGADAEAFPKDTGKLVPAGSNFEFNLHYTATGKPETDQTRMGLYFHKSPPKQELVTRAASNTELNIAPGDPDSPSQGFFRVDRPVTLWSLSPHMHFRGSRMKYTAVYPDGREEVLLSVPNYNFAWQTMYEFKEPKSLPAHTRIVLEGAFDNSAGNPFNPDASKRVRFGEQTFEEMFIGFMNYSYDSGAPAVPLPVEAQAGHAPVTAESLPGTEWQVYNYRIRFGVNFRLVVNDVLQGSWQIEDGKVMVRVAGNTYEFRIDGNKLVARDDTPMERIS